MLHGAKYTFLYTHRHTHNKNNTFKFGCSRVQIASICIYIIHVKNQWKNIMGNMSPRSNWLDCVCVCLLIAYTYRHTHIFESSDRYQKTNIISFLLYTRCSFFADYRTRILDFISTHFCCLICIVAKIESLIRRYGTNVCVCVIDKERREGEEWGRYGEHDTRLM